MTRALSARCNPWFLALAVLLPLAVLSGTAGRADDRDAPWLTGQLLVASEKMRDPRFAESVIVMIEHDARGAMGLVVNQPVGEMPMDRLLEGLGLENDRIEGSIQVYSGGPVQPGRGFILHSDDVVTDRSVAVAGGLAVATDPDLLRRLATGDGPKQAVFMLGYAGWGPGQLESEIAAGAWHSVPSDRSLVFDRPDADKWQAAVARRGIEL